MAGFQELFSPRSTKEAFITEWALLKEIVMKKTLLGEGAPHELGAQRC